MIKPHIKPKRDFGNQPYLIKGKLVKSGFVVTNGGLVNIMPGAVWFQTIPEALYAIWALDKSKGNTDIFYQLLWDYRKDN